MKKCACKYKVMVALLCAVCLCLPLSACSGDGGGRNNVEAGEKAEKAEKAKFVNFDAIEKEYLDTLKELNWPEGYSLPTRMEGEEKGASFQAGWGVTRASMLWEGAWMKEWLKSYKTDTKRADAAIKELEKAFRMQYMNPPVCDDSTRRFLKDCLDKAKLGDPSGIEKNVRLNCSE